MSAVESGRERRKLPADIVVECELFEGDCLSAMGGGLISARTSPSKHVYDEHGYVPRISNICFRINCIVALSGIFVPGS